MAGLAAGVGPALLVTLLLSAGTSAAQVQEGATMTVLRDQVAVLHPDGSMVQPARSGTLVRAGHKIRTLTRTGALITFSIGTEIELGEETALVIERVEARGGTVDVSLKQVFGDSLHHVQALIYLGSAY